MRIEVNLQTGETTEHPDAPVTWEVPTEPVIVQPTKEELMAKLLEIQTQLEGMQ
jgi:hypothetical protein